MDDIQFPTPTKRDNDLYVSAYSASYPEIKNTIVVSPYPGDRWTYFYPDIIILPTPSDRIFPSIQRAVEAAKDKLRKDLLGRLEKARNEMRESANASEQIDDYLRSLKADN